jgi:hypothetical protein
MADDSPRLRLEMIGRKPILAREAGLAIERIANAFDQAVRSSQIGPIDGRLELSEIRFGSLFVDLRFLSVVAYTAWDQREALANFMSFLSDSLNVFKSLRPNPVPPAHRSALEALAAPVARDHATQVNLFLVGDNENRIEIGRELAETILSVVGRPRSAGPFSSSGRLQHEIEASTARRQKQDAASEALAEERVQTFLHRDSALTTGTLRSIDGAWYVRPEGFGGLFMPADLHGGLKPRPIPSFQYLVEGKVMGDAEPSRFAVLRILSTAAPAG